MAGYDQTIVIRARYVPIALHFFAFLQKVGRRYKRPVKIKYRYQRRGHFYVTVDGGSGSIDALFQELVLNRGLYYYGCAIENRQEIITSVVLPIFRQLINERFSVLLTYTDEVNSQTKVDDESELTISQISYENVAKKLAEFYKKISKKLTKTGTVIFNRLYYTNHISKAKIFLDKLSKIFKYCISKNIKYNSMVFAKI